MKRACETCGTSIVTARADARYCSTRCRVAGHRKKPTGLTPLYSERRWVGWDSQKRPRTPDGGFASSVDPETWFNRDQIDGTRVGFVLGDGYACIDLDHCLEDGALTPAAAEYLKRYPRHHIEVSPSGTGLHIWGTANPGPGSRATIGGLSIERYTTGRYITVTGNTYQAGDLLPL